MMKEMAYHIYIILESEEYKDNCYFKTVSSREEVRR